ncbi:MAG: BMP family ABC transporter substrate-binding protein [Sulfolobales archaeon]
MKRKVRGISKAAAVIIAIIVIAAAGGVLYWYTTIGPAAPRKLKIAVVSDIGGRGDLSFNDMAFKGGGEAEKDFGIDMIELVSKVEADYVPNLEIGAKDPDVKLIIGVGFLLSDALVEVALKYPDKNFAGIDTYSQDIVKEKYPDKYPLPNLMDIKFEEHKGSALVGAVGCLLAAYHNERGGAYPYIGGVFGIEIPVLWKFEIGYKWGCDWALKWYEKKFGRKAPVIGEDSRYGTGPNWKDGTYCPPETPGECWYKGRVLWTYTGTFSDITKGYEAAKPMYAKGAVAVYNIAGPLGLGINQAVKEIAESKNLEMGPPFWIGVDANQDWINPGFVIISMMKRVDRGVYYATKLVLEGKFRDVVKQSNGVMNLGIGTSILGTPMEGISASTLKDLDEFIQMGVEAEKLTGKKVLPMSPDEIKAKVEKMRGSVASWVWDALAELEEKIRKGEVTVPLAFTKDAIDYWRSILG